MIPRISYAPISEAWGDAGPIVSYKEQPQAPSSLSVQNIRGVLQRAYMRHGIGGVMPYLDPAIVRDLKKTSAYAGRSRNRAGFFQDEKVLFLLLALLALLLIR